MVELVTIIASLLGSFVGGLCGIGNYMLIIPLMSLVLPIQTVILACCLSGPFLCILLFLKYRKFCRWRSLIPMLLGAMPGTLTGVWIIKVVAGEVLQLLMGVVLMAFLLWQLKGKTSRGREKATLGSVAGYFGGLLGASISVGGPPVAAYGLYSGWGPQAFLGTLGTFYLVRSAMACATQASAGLYGADILHLALFMVPSCLLGTALTFPVIKRVNVTIFRAIVMGVILVAALSCLWNARVLFSQ